jgi:hypothetical protein
MTGSTATLVELAEASRTDPSDIIEALLDRLDDVDRRDFLHGLTERVLHVRDDPTEAAAFELHRWVGSWWISVNLRDDPSYVVADAEALKLLEGGAVGDGITGSELRARYGR